MFYSGNIVNRIIFVNVSKSSDPERLNNICVANVFDQSAWKFKGIFFTEIEDQGSLYPILKSSNTE
jgi:hypothetical protein